MDIFPPTTGICRGSIRDGKYQLTAQERLAAMRFRTPLDLATKDVPPTEISSNIVVSGFEVYRIIQLECTAAQSEDTLTR